MKIQSKFIFLSFLFKCQILNFAQSWIRNKKLSALQWSMNIQGKGKGNLHNVDIFLKLKLFEAELIFGKACLLGSIHTNKSN